MSKLRAEGVQAGDDWPARWEKMRHEANEWADMAINGLQWVRNIQDGTSTADAALANLNTNLAHCRATQALASAPVAGEPVTVDIYVYREGNRYLASALLPNDTPLRPGLNTLYAAPQASEAAPFAPDWANYRQGLEDGKAGASEAVRQAIKGCGSKVIKALAAIARADGPDTRKADDPELIYRSPVMDEVVRIRQAYDELEVALKTQADKDGGNWEPQTPQQIVANMRNFARADGFDWPDPDCAKGAGDGFGSPLTPYGLLARALRVATGTTLMQMARETGRTPAEISSYEFGREAPDESWFESAAFFFASNGIVVAPTSLRKAHERALAALAAQPSGNSGELAAQKQGDSDEA